MGSSPIMMGHAARTSLALLLLLLCLPFTAPFASHRSTRHRRIYLAATTGANSKPTKTEVLQQEIRAQIELAQQQRARVEQEIATFENDIGQFQRGIGQLEQQIAADQLKLTEADEDVVKLLDRLSRVQAAAEAGGGGGLSGAGLIPVAGIPLVALAAGRQVLLQRKQIEEEKRLAEKKRKEAESKKKLIGQKLNPKQIAPVALGVLGLAFGSNFIVSQTDRTAPGDADFPAMNEQVTTTVTEGSVDITILPSDGSSGRSGGDLGDSSAKDNVVGKSPDPNLGSEAKVEESNQMEEKTKPTELNSNSHSPFAVKPAEDSTAETTKETVAATEETSATPDVSSSKDSTSSTESGVEAKDQQISPELEQRTSELIDEEAPPTPEPASKPVESSSGIDLKSFFKMETKTAEDDDATSGVDLVTETELAGAKENVSSEGKSTTGKVLKEADVSMKATGLTSSEAIRSETASKTITASEKPDAVTASVVKTDSDATAGSSKDDETSNKLSAKEAKAEAKVAKEEKATPVVELPERSSDASTNRLQADDDKTRVDMTKAYDTKKQNDGLAELSIKEQSGSNPDDRGSKKEMTTVTTKKQQRAEVLSLPRLDMDDAVTAPAGTDQPEEKVKGFNFKSLQYPSFSLPKFEMPNIDLPTLKPADTDVLVPQLDEVAPPEPELPMSGLKRRFPSLNMPKFDFAPPKLDIEFLQSKLPDISSKIQDLKLPDLPKVDIPQPDAFVNPLQNLKIAQVEVPERFKEKGKELFGVDSVDPLALGIGGVASLVVAGAIGTSLSDLEGEGKEVAVGTNESSGGNSTKPENEEKFATNAAYRSAAKGLASDDGVKEKPSVATRKLKKQAPANPVGSQSIPGAADTPSKYIEQAKSPTKKTTPPPPTKRDPAATGAVETKSVSGSMPKPGKSASTSIESKNGPSDTTIGPPTTERYPSAFVRTSPVTPKVDGRGNPDPTPDAKSLPSKPQGPSANIETQVITESAPTGRGVRPETTPPQPLKKNPSATTGGESVPKVPKQDAPTKTKSQTSGGFDPNPPSFMRTPSSNADKASTVSPSPWSPQRSTPAPPMTPKPSPESSLPYDTTSPSPWSPQRSDPPTQADSATSAKNRLPYDPPGSPNASVNAASNQTSDKVSESSPPQSPKPEFPPPLEFQPNPPRFPRESTLQPSDDIGSRPDPSLSDAASFDRVAKPPRTEPTIPTDPSATAATFEPTPPTELPKREQIYGLDPNFTFNEQKRKAAADAQSAAESTTAPSKPPPPYIKPTTEQQLGSVDQPQQSSIPSEKSQPLSKSGADSSTPPVEQTGVADEQSIGDQSAGERDGTTKKDDSRSVWEDADEPGFQ